MDINWHIDRCDVDRVKDLIAKQTAAGNRLIRHRKEINLSENKPAVTRPKFWREMVLARLTVQARAGPTSPVHKLSKAEPFPLALRKVRSEQDVKGFIAETIQAHGIGKHNQHAEYLATNLDLLEDDEWKRL